MSRWSELGRRLPSARRSTTCRWSTTGSGGSTFVAGGATRAAYDEAVAEYLAAIEGRDPTDLYVIVVAGEDVGLIQTYLLADYPDYAALIGAGDEAAGLDIFLGEAELTGSGLGTDVDSHLRVGRSSSPAPRRELASPTPTSATSPRSARSRRPASRPWRRSSTRRTTRSTR